MAYAVPSAILWLGLACGGLLLASGFLRVDAGRRLSIIDWTGKEETVIGPRLLFRPWPFFSRRPLAVGPVSELVTSIRPLTANGYRLCLTAHVLYELHGPNSSSTGPVVSKLVQRLVHSGFAQCVGEVDLQDFILHQKQLSEKVKRSIEETLFEQGAEILLVEIIEIGSVGFGSARSALGDDVRRRSALAAAKQTLGVA